MNQSINNSNVSRDRKNVQTQKINESNLLSFENQYIVGSNAGSQNSNKAKNFKRADKNRGEEPEDTESYS